MDQVHLLESHPQFHLLLLNCAQSDKSHLVSLKATTCCCEDSELSSRHVFIVALSFVISSPGLPPLHGGQAPGWSSTFASWADFLTPMSVLCHDQHPRTYSNISSFRRPASDLTLTTDLFFSCTACSCPSPWLEIIIFYEPVVFTFPNGRVFFCWNKSGLIRLMWGIHSCSLWSQNYATRAEQSLFGLATHPFIWTRLVRTPSNQILCKLLPLFLNVIRLSIPSFHTTPRYLALSASPLINNSISTLNGTPVQRVSSYKYLSICRQGFWAPWKEI